jgi:hypothetical protein
MLTAKAEIEDRIEGLEVEHIRIFPNPFIPAFDDPWKINSPRKLFRNHSGIEGESF